MTGTPDTTLVAADGFMADGSFSDAQLTPTGYGENSSATSGYKAFIPGQSKFVIAETRPRPARILSQARLLRPHVGDQRAVGLAGVGHDGCDLPERRG